MSTSKTGKHGHAKVHLVALDIFNQKKYEDICPSTHNMDVPNVSRKDFQLLDVSDDGYLSLMDDGGNTRDDLKVPEGDIGEEIKSSMEDGKDILVSLHLRRVGSWLPICYSKEKSLTLFVLVWIAITYLVDNASPLEVSVKLGILVPILLSFSAFVVSLT